MAVDTQGFSHAWCVTTDNVTDRAGAIMALERSNKDLSGVEKVLIDGVYSGEKSTKAIRSLIDAEVEVAKRSELHPFPVMPQH